MGAEDGGGRRREMSVKITVGKGEGGKVCVGGGLERRCVQKW